MTPESAGLLGVGLIILAACSVAIYAQFHDKRASVVSCEDSSLRIHLYHTWDGRRTLWCVRIVGTGYCSTCSHFVSADLDWYDAWQMAGLLNARYSYGKKETES